MLELIALLLAFLGLAIPLAVFYFLTKRNERVNKASSNNHHHD